MTNVKAQGFCNILMRMFDALIKVSISATIPSYCRILSVELLWQKFERHISQNDNKF